ncbi:hypothetical protein ACR42D_09985 [Desulfovibrio caledoniensis]
MSEKKAKTKETPVTLGDPVKEIVDFLDQYFGKVKDEGRRVPGLERIHALKESLDKAAK